MQIANVMVDLGGDNGNQVPKRVTAAEIAVLIAIHGESAVHDIEPIGSISRSNRDELSRLYGIYGRAKDGEDKSIVVNMFPGAGARVFETIDELGIDENFFKPTARAKTEPVKDPLDHDGNGKKGGAKKPAKKAKAAANTDEIEAAEGIPPGDDAEADEVSDGIEDMPDTEAENLFK